MIKFMELRCKRRKGREWARIYLCHGELVEPWLWTI